MFQSKKLQKIFKNYGYRHQLGKLKEEYEEVVFELKDGVFKKNENKIAWEIADLYNVLEQFRLYHGIKKSTIKKMRAFKIDRQITRMSYENKR